ncbi:MAG: MBOAT family O-acyltransferase [Halioglobus sp.]|nr:MBOAT family O-acyltransferase [Halioglobus sp.]
MLFTSPVFLFLFLPILLVLHYFTPIRFRNVLLLIASLFFYAWGETLYVLLMLASILANYGFGLAIDHTRQSRFQKRWLVLSIFFNLSMLIAFKYANFLVENINTLLEVLALPSILLDTVHLPLGISFFTFQAMSYVIDVYRGDAAVQRRFSNIALYITLFPQLIAGPIVRYHDVAKQIISRKIDSNLVLSGIRRFVLGLAKKMLIANPLGQAADAVFLMPENELGMGLVWFGIFCYALQIYFDFSGYSDMAIGLGRMFGFRFLENFNYPYTAQSLQDFWRRWHISLSRWFRDYLYIPLGGNRGSSIRTYANLFFVFLLCGLWHGASWSFVVWGLIHGCFLIFERAGLDRLLIRLWPVFRYAYTLIVVCIAWVFFRAEDLSFALSYTGTMLGFGGGSGSLSQLQNLALQSHILMAFIAGIFLATPIYPWFSRSFVIPVLEGRPRFYFLSQLSLIFSLLAFALLATASTTYNPFIYFRF